MNTNEKMIKSFLGNIEGWKSVLDSSPDLIAILDAEFKVVWVNKAMAMILNASKDSCLGLKCFEAVHGTQSPIPNCPHSKMLLDGHEYTEEVNEEHLGGCHLVTASPINDESGNVLGSIHIARDINERKKAEEQNQKLIEEMQQLNEELAASNEELQATNEELYVSNEELQNTTEELQVANEELQQQGEDLIYLNQELRESEQRMNRSQEIGHIGSWELDLVNDHLFWSDEVYRIFGLQPQEFEATYEAFLESIHPDDRKAVDTAYSGSIREGRDTYEIEHRVVRKSTGEVRIVHEKCEHFRDESGEIIRSVGMVNDITERKKAEEAILWNQKRNEILAEVSSRLLSSENPQDIIDDLCQKTMEFLKCDVFFNYLVDEKEGCLHLNAYAGIPEEEAKKIEWLDYGVTVCGYVALESQRIIAENILETEDPRADLVKSYGVQAYACHPLMIEGLSIGTLSFGTNSRTKFTDEELELMKAVADQISIAMNRLISNRILKESEKAAVQARNEWEQTFEAVPDLIAILGTDYNVIRANKAMADRFGITPEECVGLTCYEVVHGMDEPPSFCPHQQLLEDGSEHTEEVHEDSLGGDFLVSASPLYDSEGKLIGSVHVARDINRRKHMEEALAKSENEFRTLAENSPDVIARFDRQNRHIYANPAAAEPYGRPQEEIIGKTHTELGMDPEKTEFWEKHHEKVFITGKPETMEFQYKSPQGKEYYYNTRIVPEFIDGEVKSILAISRDITYIKEAEAELKKARDNLEEQVKERTLELEKAYESLKLANNYNRSLIEASLDPLVTIGPDGKITDVNYSTEMVTGHSRGELVGTDFSNYFTEPERAREGYQEVFREGWVFDYPLKIKHKDDHVTPVLYNASVYRNEDGEVIGVFAAARDITEIKQAEDEIKKQAELINLTHEAIIVKNMDNKILFWNDGAEETYGWNTEEAKGKITNQLLKTVFPEPLEDILIHLMEKGQWEGELIHTKRDGTQITVLSRWALKRDEKGNPSSILEINSDISQRKKMEEELEFAGKYNRSLIETSLDPLVTIGPDGKITDVNGATEAVTGYSRYELVGTDFSDYFTQPEKARAGYKQVFREGWVIDYLLEIQHRDGHVTPVLYNASVYEDELGNVIGVFAAARDITELKRTEAEKQKLLEQAQQIAEELEVSNEELQATTEELQVSNEELQATTNELQAANEELEFASKYNRNLIETSLDPLVTIGPDGKVTDVNMATELVTGYHRDEIIGTDFSDYFTEPEKAMDGYQAVFREGRVFDYPLEIKHKNGSITPVLYNASVYHDESGAVIGVFAAARDITERKKAERELKLASKYNRSLIEVSLDPLVTIGPDGKITDVNHSTESVTGYSRDELIGTDFSDYFTEPDKAKEGYQHVFKENYVRDYPLEIQHKEGHVTPVLYNASVYKDESGDVIGVFAAARDTTERKKYEKMLKLKLEELARSNAELEQFAYVSSHDLQEPLRMIGSYLQLLQRRYEGQLDDKADKYINFAVDGATRMQNLINDLLEFSRVTTRARELEHTDSEFVLGQVLSNLEVSIKENEAVISHHQLPTVMADSTQLVQVFQNLISNAIKFRSEKPPKIYISAYKDGGDQWIFSVADNGIGIDPKHSERIFEVFKRLHKRREYPGTGIGLSICKKIIERHGGHIWVESEPNNGSVFYFTLPEEGVVNDKDNDS